jgi:hypothetical protein
VPLARIFVTSLFAVLTVSAAIADGPPGPVGEYGGRSIGENEILILEVSPPALRRVDRRTLSSTVRLFSDVDSPVDPYGFALPADGTVWVLADKGRYLFRFSETTGERIEKRRLSEPCQGIATFWNHAGFVAVRLRPNERLLLRAENGALRPFSRLVSRSAARLPEHLIANLLKCGSGTKSAIPCWFLAGAPEILLLDPSGGIRTVEVPSLALPSRMRQGSHDPGTAFTYPVRDALLLDGDRMWVLTNQEGDRTPLEDGAMRGRHVAFVRAGNSERVIPLDREARAILDASERSVVLLFADGSVGRVGFR